MNSAASVLLVVAVGSAIWATVTMVRVCEFLRLRGEKVSFLLLRVMIFRYLRRYRAITVAETGRVGPLYHQFVTSVNVVLVTAGAAVLVLLAQR